MTVRRTATQPDADTKNQKSDREMRRRAEGNRKSIRKPACVKRTSTKHTVTEQTQPQPTDTPISGTSYTPHYQIECFAPPQMAVARGSVPGHVAFQKMLDEKTTKAHLRCKSDGSSDMQSLSVSGRKTSPENTAEDHSYARAWECRAPCCSGEK